MRFFLGLLCLLLADVAVSLDKQRDCKCRIKSKKRIVGGHEAEPMAYPWMVSLQKIEQVPPPDSLRKLVPDHEKIAQHFCGGIIINERFIITAAYCVRRKRFNEFRVAYGANDLVTLYERKLYAEIEWYRMHPEYEGSQSDVALIKLKTPLNFSEAVQPACLPARHQNHYDSVLKISGFGVTESPIEDERGHMRGLGAFSRYLKEGNTYDHSDDRELQCMKWDYICVKNRVDSRAEGTCVGDHGGPLHHTNGGRSTVIGVLSFGKPVYDPRTKERILCAGQEAFTRISVYMNWIKETAKDGLCV